MLWAETHSSRMPIAAPVQPVPVPEIPQPADDGAQKYITMILELHTALSQLPTLEPSPRVNSLFGKLVDLCAQTLDESLTAKILTDPRIVKITAHLRQVCSGGESKLEAYWADQINGTQTEKDANEMLHRFTYYNNYVELTRMELSAILSTGSESPRKFAFIGSGPLPLTSLCIADSLGEDGAQRPLVIHNIDHDSRAIQQSSELCRKLGSRAKAMRFHCTEARDAKEDLRDYDVVYVAALVGMSWAQKEDIIADVVDRMRPGALLILRSAHSLRSLLYPVVKITSILALARVEPLIVVHPYNHIINSVVVLRVKPSTPMKR
ncbi:putative 26S proteasome regulatory subunit [Acarospora aff. strigata]|nr:putative 26S proteasome regulatory subunit [Acarospora aff. strigata]